MTLETTNSPNSLIDPYLNLAYWDGRYIGDGTTEAWPIRKSRMLEAGLAYKFLTTYIERGASKLALTRVATGETFDASDYPTGTILLSLCEGISQGNERCPPMAQFAEQPLPAQRPSLADDEQLLEGHGYHYFASPLLNVTTNLGKPNVYLVSDSLVRSNAANRAIASKLTPGVPAYTVGETYNYGAPGDENLVRVNELIVCMYGVGSKGRRVPESTPHTLPGNVALGGGTISP